MASLLAAPVRSHTPFLVLHALVLAATVVPSAFCAVSVSQLSHSQYRTRWEAHVARFHNGDKAFLATKERFEAFRKTLDYVRLQNARFYAGEATSTAELNYRAAYLPSERLHGHFRPELKGTANKTAMPPPPAAKASPPPVKKSPPPPHRRGRLTRKLLEAQSQDTSYSTATVDWTQVPNVLNPIENQGQCGSCWAFAATAAIESITGITTGTLPLLSEQELMDCSNGPAGGPGTGCNGGFADAAMSWVVQNGQATLDSYPYVAANQGCQGSGTFGANISGYAYVTANSDSALMNAVAVQPVVITIAASSQAFQSYSGGIFNDATDCGTALDHQVVVVGYGYDSSSGLNYYILRNQWDTWWGEGGYMRIAMMGDGTMGVCGMLQESPVYPSL